MGRHLTTTLGAVALFGLAAVAGLAGPSQPDGTPAAAAFQLQDGSAACNYSSGELACRAAGAPAAAVLAADGDSRADADALVTWDESTPVLLASESWWNGAFRCRVADRVIHCSAGDGAIEAGEAGVGGVR